MANRKGVFIGAYVPNELKESLRRRAAGEHRTLSQEITRILVEAVHGKGLPAGSVREFHVAGHARNGNVLIDDHGSRVCEEVWELENGNLYIHKGDYEKLAAAIQSVEDRAFVLLKQRYKEDYFRSLLTNPSSGSNFLYCAPASASFARSGAGWSRFYFNNSSYQSNHKFQTSSTEAGGMFHIGSFGIAGAGGADHSNWQGGIDTSQFRMEFSMCRVPIARPWLNIDYLLSGFWRFDQSNEVVKNTMVSDGKKPPLHAGFKSEAARRRTGSVLACLACIERRGI